MKLTGNTILITGGNAGIGLAFAERFLKAGNKVIVTGRREHALQKAKETYPELITYVSDLSIPSERISLFDWVKKLSGSECVSKQRGDSTTFSCAESGCEGQLGLFQ